MARDRQSLRRQSRLSSIHFDRGRAITKRGVRHDLFNLAIAALANIAIKHKTQSPMLRRKKSLYNLPPFVPYVRIEGCCSGTMQLQVVLWH